MNSKTPSDKSVKFYRYNRLIDENNRHRTVGGLVILTVNVDTSDLREVNKLLNKENLKINAIYPSRSECFRFAMRDFLVNFIKENNVLDNPTFIHQVENMKLKRIRTRKLIESELGYRSSDKLIAQEFGDGLPIEMYRNERTRLEEEGRIITVRNGTNIKTYSIIERNKNGD